MDAGFQQPTGDIAMSLSRSGDADSVDLSYELTPVGGPVRTAISSNCTCRLLVQVTYFDESRESFPGECGMNSSVLTGAGPRIEKVNS